MSKRKGTNEHHDEHELPKKEEGGFCTFLYNRKTGLVMGRSCVAWFKLITFYLIFYAFLIGFWIAYLYGFMATTNTDKPNLTGHDSLLKLNPAIGYRPQLDFEANLIKFNQSVPASYAAHVQEMNTFLKPYLDESYQSKLEKCSAGPDGKTANATQGCQFRPSEVASVCLPQAGNDPASTFGFPEGKPCIILKMNRIYGWLSANLPSPQTGYQDIRIRCYGENDADAETIGEIEYYPGGRDEKGPYGVIPSYYLPFLNQKEYLSPLVFARFANLKHYTVALLWCEFDHEPMNFPGHTQWISRALNERAGGAHFELLVDK